MKLEKAIEILDEEPITCQPGRKSELEQALKLGIEALKVIRDKRGYPEYIIPRKLPGETED